MTSKPSSQPTTAAILVLVCAAAIALGTLTRHWGVSDAGGVSVRAGLLGADMCLDGKCVSGAWSDGTETSVEVLAYLGLAGAVIAIGACIALGGLVLGRHVAKIPVDALNLVLGVSGGAQLLFLIRVLTMDAQAGGDLSPGWSALAAIGGVVGAMVLVQAMIAPAVRAVQAPGTYHLDVRKLGAIGVLLSVAGLVTALFLWMVGPAAAREVQAACNGMDPSWSNAAFGRLPTAAPDFALEDVDGKPVKLSDYRGKVVLVNFWASWCDVCKAEKKSLARITRDLQGQDFAVLAVASDSDKDAIDHSLKVALGGPEQASDRKWGGAPFRILVDPPKSQNLGDVAHAWGIEKVPESFLVDRKGNIRMYLVNKREWNASVVETCVQSLIDE